MACDDLTARPDGPGRRQFLLKAATAGAVAFAAPAIITMQPAGAAGLNSPPPKPPEVDPRVETAGPVPAVEGATVSAKAASAGQLPFTGANVEQLAIAGLAATAGGAALQFWSTKLGTPPAGPPDAPPAAPAGT